MNIFNWMSEFGVTLLNIGQDLFNMLTTSVSIPFIGTYTLLEIGITALPIVLVPILVYKAIT